MNCLDKSRHVTHHWMSAGLLDHFMWQRLRLRPVRFSWVWATCPGVTSTSKQLSSGPMARLSLEQAKSSMTMRRLFVGRTLAGWSAWACCPVAASIIAMQMPPRPMARLPWDIADPAQVNSAPATMFFLLAWLAPEQQSTDSKHLQIPPRLTRPSLTPRICWLATIHLAHCVFEMPAQSVRRIRNVAAVGQRPDSSVSLDLAQKMKAPTVSREPAA